MNQSRLEANHHVTVAKRGKTCTVRVSHDWSNLTTDWMTDGANYLSQSLSVMMQKFMTFDNQVKSALSPPFRLVSVPFTPFFHAQDFTGWKSINTDFQALNIYRRYKMKKKKEKKISSFEGIVFVCFYLDHLDILNLRIKMLLVACSSPHFSSVE